ncbi:MAG: sulfite oxidase [Solirubrobacteraceae bacterium]|nr:sulfite oxidase [Solirubrobacteraceae bacterium]
MSRFGKRADMVVHEREPYNAEPPRAALAQGALTPRDTFYVRGHGPVPEGDEHDWQIELDGLLEHPLVVTLAELRSGRWPHHELIATLQCAGNRRRDLAAVRPIPGEAPWGPGATGTARWGGVALSDVLALAQPRAEATHVAFVGADVSPEADPPQLYGASIPLAKALHGEVLLTYEMDDEALPTVHGGPLRVVVPGYIGARSVKWLTRIELRSSPWPGYFQSTAYRLLAPDESPGPGQGMELGEVALNGDFLSPADGAQLAPGTIPLAGYAFAGGAREVARVEVSADGGRHWVQARLGGDQGPWAWRQWQAEIDLSPGEHELVARAWDTSANTQPERPETVWNPKGYVNTSWARIRVRVSGATAAGAASASGS